MDGWIDCWMDESVEGRVRNGRWMEVWMNI